MSTFTHAISTNNYGPAKFIVDASAANGTHTTIAAALSSSASGDTIFIRPGTYTENLTLKAGVNLAAFGSDSSLNGTGKVIISGTCTMTTAGSVTISGIQLQTNSAALLAVTGSANSIVNLENCFLNCTNNSGITYSTSGTSSAINLFRCEGDLGTTGIIYFAHSAGGVMNVNFCTFENSGASVTNSTISSGTLNLKNTLLKNSITTSSTGTVNGRFATIPSVNNNTAFTQGGTNTCAFEFCEFTGGSASAISVGAGCTFSAIQCDISSTNTNAVTGAGSSNLVGTTFSNSSTMNNTTTQTGGMAVGYQKAPSAGFVGEQIRATVASGSPISISTTTATDIASISLTPGVWDVSCVTQFKGMTTGTVLRTSISTTSVTEGTFGDNLVSFPFLSQAVTDLGLTIPSYRITLTSTTTVYMVALAVYTVGTGSGYGRLSATRVG